MYIYQTSFASYSPADQELASALPRFSCARDRSSFWDAGVAIADDAQAEEVMRCKTICWEKPWNLTQTTHHMENDLCLRLSKWLNYISRRNRVVCRLLGFQLIAIVFFSFFETDGLKTTLKFAGFPCGKRCRCGSHRCLSVLYLNLNGPDPL